MRMLVTGGAGFIGSHLTEALLAAGHEVTVIDDLSTGRASNLKAVESNERLTTRWASILQDERLDKFIEQSDIVFHLAAAVGVRLILEKPVDTIEANVLGTDRVLKAAARAQCTVVIASTSEVYGKNERVPLSEEDDGVFGPTVKSRWSYAVSKAIDEFLGLAYCRDRGVPVVIVRYFNTIGPRQVGRYGMVVPRFVRQALAGEPITVYGDGEQTRSFTDVQDTVRATFGLGLHAAAVGQVFNVGNGHVVTINELAAKVKALTRSRSEIVHVPFDHAYEAGFEEPRQRVPDITKLRRTLDFTPAVDLDTTLRNVIEFERRQG